MSPHLSLPSLTCDGPDDVTEVGEGVSLHLQAGHDAGVDHDLPHLHHQAILVTQRRVDNVHNLG